MRCAASTDWSLREVQLHLLQQTKTKIEEMIQTSVNNDFVAEAIGTEDSELVGAVDALKQVVSKLGDGQDLFDVIMPDTGVEEQRPRYDT